MRTLVIGGGAAGMVAAITAAKRGDTVTVLERNGKILKKLGVTGNGRGNVLNAGKPVYYGDTAFAEEVLRHMPYARIAGFLEELGIPLCEESEGRVYPAALKASVVVDALRLAVAQLGVKVVCHTKVIHLKPDGEGFLAEAEESVIGVLPDGIMPDGMMPVNNKKKLKTATIATTRRKYRADCVIVAAGGAAAPAHGTDGTGYGLLTGFGHTLVSPRPALCALLTGRKHLAGLAGQRVRAALTLTAIDGTVLHTTSGEALFADDGVSGIAGMQLSRFVEDGCELHMDLRPAIGKAGMDLAALSRWLKSLAGGRMGLPVSELFTGVMTLPLARTLLKAADMAWLERPIETLDDIAFRILAHTIADVSLPVTGVRGFDSAQVTAGGITAWEFNPTTMESCLRKGLYAVGEVLDVDGDCGGFNLMFAFGSGLIAGGIYKIESNV